MCEPGIVMASLAVATTAASVVSEIKTANRQNDAIGTALNTSLNEIEKNRAAELDDRIREARREQGRVRTAAGEAGLQLTGSVETLLTDSNMQTALARERTDLNTENRRRAAIDQANSQYSQVQKPNLLGTGLRLVTSGVQGYYQGQGLQVQRRAAANGGSQGG